MNVKHINTSALIQVLIIDALRMCVRPEARIGLRQGTVLRGDAEEELDRRFHAGVEAPPNNSRWHTPGAAHPTAGGYTVVSNEEFARLQETIEEQATTITRLTKNKNARAQINTLDTAELDELRALVAAKDKALEERTAEYLRAYLEVGILRAEARGRGNKGTNS